MAARLLRTGFAPALGLGFGGGGVAWITVGGGVPGVLLILGLAVATTFTAEALLPYRRDWNRSHRDRLCDGLHAVVNESLSLVSLATLPIIVGWLGVSGVWPHGAPFGVQVVGAVLVLDLGITLVHFASHRNPWLWRFHAVHHSVTRLYGFNGLMKHPLHQALEMLGGTVPLVLIGLPADVALALVFLVAIQLLLQHANVDYTVGPLRTWLATCEAHRLHHRKHAGEGDVNFGLFTCLWDRMLGTAADAVTENQVEPGDVGIAAEPDYPSGYGAQLIQPFRVLPRAAA